MSGHMIGVDIELGRLFYLANIEDQQEACSAVMEATGENNAEALAPLPDTVFQFTGTPKGKIAPYHPG